MFICKCGSCFFDPTVIRERVGEFWGDPAYETRHVCPVCGEGDYEEAADCRCGGHKHIGDAFCESCSRVLRERFARMMYDFTDEEREYVLENADRALEEFKEECSSG